MDKMKAANGINFGHIESPDFPGGMLVMKNNQLTIINGAMGGNNFERPVTQSNIKIFKLIGCGGSWAKYYLEFKDGKSGVVTQDVLTDAEKRQSGANMASIERFLKFVDVAPTPIVVSSSQTQAIPQKPLVCPQCGAPIDDEMLFCGECGKKLK